MRYRILKQLPVRCREGVRSLDADLYPSVLRMLSNYLGEESFLKGVSLYMKKHLYANSVTKDLWEGISEASGASPNSVQSTLLSSY